MTTPLRAPTPPPVASGDRRGDGPEPPVWGKLAFDAAGAVARVQPLAAHCRDVAAIFAALLALDGVHERLTRLAGCPLHEVTVARLTYLVHLHDMGKVNAGFQARADPGARIVGHVAPLACLLGDAADPTLSARALDALAGDQLEGWGEGLGPLLDAILSHHGRPWGRTEPRIGDRRHWCPTPRGYDPFTALSALRDDADAFAPLARATPAAPLPAAPGFVHAVAGLAQLADWVASSDWERAPDDAGRPEWAASRLRAIGLDPAPWRTPLLARGLPSFEALFDDAPYPHQARAGTAQGRLLVLESDTGSGKTEAALWRFASLFAAGAVDGLYFALPTRTAAMQLHARVERFAARLWPQGAPPVVLAVPGYLGDAGDNAAGSHALPTVRDSLDAEEGAGGETDVVRGAPVWAAEHPKRYFAGVLAVGTVDQALLAALRVKHAHLRGATLMRHLLVVDEVHASDAYMRRLLGGLLRDHLAAGGHAMLLSATLGAEARHQFVVEASGGRVIDEPAPSAETATRVPYPLLSVAAPAGAPLAVAARGGDKVVRMELREWLDDPAAIAAHAVAAAMDGARVLVVRNTVDGAVAVQRAVEVRAEVLDAREVLFRAADVPTLHHGRFAREDRWLLDAAVEGAVGRTRTGPGRVIVGTQTLEQSLDLDADLLLTDLCPVDVLLQRLGRLHRHATDGERRPRARPTAHAAPRCIVLVPAGGLAPFLAATRPGKLPRHGLGHRLENGVPRGVYADLAVVEATRQLIIASPEWRIPSMNRALVEAALHSEAVDALLAAIPDEERERWRRHRSAVEGSRMADAQVATDGALRRDRAFMEDPNTRFDERLVTRLGADDRLVDLPTATVGPFAHPVRRLAVPGWMARGIDADAVATVTPEPGRDGTSARLHVRLGKLDLVYDRHGLRRAEEH